MEAPIPASGVITRFMGRLPRLSSPPRTVSKFCGARMPQRILVVVPLLPVSSRTAPSLMYSGSGVSPRRPRP